MPTYHVTLSADNVEALLRGARATGQSQQLIAMNPEVTLVLRVKDQTGEGEAWKT